MQYKNLLVVCHSYNDFQKDTTISTSRYIDNVAALVRYNPLANLTKYINLPRLNQSSLNYKIDLVDNPTNIQIYPTPVYYIPSDSQYKNLGEKHLKVVESLIKKNNILFDIIHSHFTWSSGYVGAKLKEKYNVPFVVTAHGYDIYDLPFRDKEWEKKVEHVLNSADYIITVSRRNLELIRQLNVSTPVKVLPNGFRNDLFYPRSLDECRKVLNLPMNKKIIVSVGTLTEVKGHKYLIEAMSKITEKRQDVLCIIVGDGVLRSKLSQQINSLKLQNYVWLSGGRHHAEIPIWINACDLFVLPSLNEGNPTVMFECLGCGKPFVGTKVGGVPEIIKSECYGLLCSSGNSEELTEKILLALSKSWNIEKIEDYSKNFLWGNICKEICTIYNSI